MECIELFKFCDLTVLFYYLSIWTYYNVVSVWEALHLAEWKTVIQDHGQKMEAILIWLLFCNILYAGCLGKSLGRI